MNVAARSTVQRAFNRDSVLALLQEAARADATDLHFKVPCPPMMRVGGTLRRLGDLVLTAHDTLDVAMSLANLAGIEIVLRDEVEFAFGIPKLGRFRANIYRQRGSHAVVLHRVRIHPPSLEELGAPPALIDVLARPGLTLVAGPNQTGLLHALVRSYNAIMSGHLVLVESPITFLHRDDRAVISHREVGQDTIDFPTAIRRAVRAAADQLVVGDVPDPNTAEALLDAAESGLCVLVAVRAPGVEVAPEWFLRQFAGDRHEEASGRLKRVLRTCVSLPASTVRES